MCISTDTFFTCYKSQDTCRRTDAQKHEHKGSTFCSEWVTMQSGFWCRAAKGPCLTFPWPEHANMLHPESLVMPKKPRHPSREAFYSVILYYALTVVPPDTLPQSWPIDSLTTKEEMASDVRDSEKQGGEPDQGGWGKPCDQHGQSQTPHNVSTLGTLRSFSSRVLTCPSYISATLLAALYESVQSPEL